MVSSARCNLLWDNSFTYIPSHQVLIVQLRVRRSFQFYSSFGSFEPEKKDVWTLIKNAFNIKWNLQAVHLFLHLEAEFLAPQEPYERRLWWYLGHFLFSPKFTVCFLKVGKTLLFSPLWKLPYSSPYHTNHNIVPIIFIRISYSYNISFIILQ